jgi:hypothetical protein
LSESKCQRLFIFWASSWTSRTSTLNRRLNLLLSDQFVPFNYLPTGTWSPPVNCILLLLTSDSCIYKRNFWC